MEVKLCEDDSLNR